MLLKPKKKSYPLPTTYQVPTKTMNYVFQWKIKSNDPHVQTYDIIWARVRWISTRTPVTKSSTRDHTASLFCFIQHRSIPRSLQRWVLINSSKGVFGTVPVFSVPVWMSHRTYRSVRYRYWCRTETTEASVTGMKVCTLTGCTGIHVVPNLQICPLMLYRTYRSVPYRYWYYTKLAEESVTGNAGGMPLYVPCRTHQCKIQHSENL